MNKTEVIIPQQAARRPAPIRFNLISKTPTITAARATEAIEQIIIQLFVL